MSRAQPCKLSRLSTQLALAGILSLSIIGLTACHSSKANIVKCTGVPLKQGHSLYIDGGICKKLGGGKPTPIKCTKWSIAKKDTIICLDPGSKLTAKKYATSEYVKCYGVAAAGMNDCGTKTTACGGTVHVARAKDAWIALPGGLCKQIKGSVVGKIKD